MNALHVALIIIKKYWFLVSQIFLMSIMVFFLVIPIAKMIFGVDFETLIKTFGDKEVQNSIFLTLRVSLYSTFFVLVFGLPLAYVIARYDFWGKSALETIIDIPIMIPHTAAGIALLVVFGRGELAQFFAFLGIEFENTVYGIMIAMMFLSSTFLINGAKEGFKKVDPTLENVSRSLGANSLQTFMRISIPNAKKDIINGALMMWGRGLGEFGAVAILVYHPMSAPVLIYDRFTSYGLAYSAPVASLMIIISIVIFLVIRIINNKLD